MSEDPPKYEEVPQSDAPAPVPAPPQGQPPAYTANQAYPPPGAYPPYPPQPGYPPQASYPAQTYPPAQPYPPTQAYPPAQPYPAAQAYSQAQPYPPTQAYPQAQPYPAQSYPAQAYPAQQYPSGQHAKAGVSTHPTTVVVGEVIQRDPQQDLNNRRNVGILSFFACFFCCCPFGSVALYKVYQSSECERTGDHALADLHLQAAKRWAIIAIIAGLTSYVIYSIKSMLA